jgi:hypothetical protein
VKTHSLNENDNNLMDELAQLLTDMAEKHNIAVDISHHTRKGAAEPGNADRGRGATATKDAGRLVYTLTRMSPDEAKMFGIEEDERLLYIRMDSARVNICRPTTATWFKLVGVKLGNGNELYPNGDEVQTVERWTPPATWANTDSDLLNRILDDIDACMPDGNRYSDAPKSEKRAAWEIVTKHIPEKTEGQAREIIRTWVRIGVLVKRDYDDPVQRKPVKGLFVDPTKRPT